MGVLNVDSQVLCWHSSSGLFHELQFCLIAASSSSWRFTTVTARVWQRVRSTRSWWGLGLSPGRQTRSRWASWPVSIATPGDRPTTACWEVDHMTKHTPIRWIYIEYNSSQNSRNLVESKCMFVILYQKIIYIKYDSLNVILIVFMSFVSVSVWLR